MAPKKGQTKIAIYPDWCKGCGICVAFCPAKVLVLAPSGKAAAARPEDCLNCGFCERHCPDFAIVISPKDGARRRGPSSKDTKEAHHADPSPEKT